MVCNLTLVCVQVRVVMLIKELAQGAAQKVSPIHFLILRDMRAMQSWNICYKVITIIVVLINTNNILKQGMKCINVF